LTGIIFFSSLNAQDVDADSLLNRNRDQNTVQELKPPAQGDSSKTTILQDKLSRQTENIL
jgi:hypothetical protein